MELLLIRHGQPEWVKDGRNVNRPPLTELGHRQAAAMAHSLREEQIDHVYVSPLIRARQTAEPLRAITGHDEIIDPWLEEIRDPPWEGELEEVAIAAYEAERERHWEDRWSGMSHIGAERLDDFTARIHAGAEEFLARHGVTRIDHDLPVWRIDPASIGIRIALVAHAGTNSTVLCHLLGVAPTPWEWDRFKMLHSSITRLSAIKAGDAYHFSLSQLSGAEHLPLGERTG